MTIDATQTVWCYSKERFLSPEGYWKSWVTVGDFSGEYVKENAFEMYDEFVISYPENWDGPDMPPYKKLENCSRLITIPGSDTFPHLATSGGEIFLYDPVTEEYIQQNSLRTLNQSKDEFINAMCLEEYCNYFFCFYAFWYQDSKMYAMTRNRTGLPYSYYLWEYVQSIQGSMSVGPLTTSVARHNGRYAS